MIAPKLSAPTFETRPLYLQVHGQLMSFIVNGTWKAGDMIPNEVDLARDFGVSVGTMRKALQTLTEQGLLTRRQGRGTFVAEPESLESSPLDNLRTSAHQALKWTTRRTDLSTGKASAAEAAALEIPLHAEVFRLRRIMSDAGTSSSLLEYCTYPYILFPGLAGDREAHGLPISQLARRFGLLIGPSTERIGAFSADSEKSKLLEVQVGATLLKLERIATSFENIPVEFRIAFCILGPGVMYSNRMR